MHSTGNRTRSLYLNISHHPLQLHELRLLHTYTCLNQTQGTALLKITRFCNWTIYTLRTWSDWWASHSGNGLGIFSTKKSHGKEGTWAEGLRLLRTASARQQSSACRMGLLKKVAIVSQTGSVSWNPWWRFRQAALPCNRSWRCL